MLLDFEKRIINEIRKNWGIFDSLLLDVTHVLEFDSFLENYRGLYQPRLDKVSYEKIQIKNKFVDSITDFFDNIFSVFGLAEYSAIDIEHLLLRVESGVNLLLYYWRGYNNNNFQFRTIIHFFNLEGFQKVFLTKEHVSFVLSLVDRGIIFARVDQKREAKLLAVSQICGLQKMMLDYQENASDQQEFFNFERKILAKTFTIEREVCRLIDEWEYLNAILAVEYTEASKNKQTKNYQDILERMDSRRLELAQWCLQSFVEFQEWISRVNSKITHKDISAEIEALAALILASVQKIFLPASVSKLKYTENIVEYIGLFMQERLIYCVDDFSSRLVLQVVVSAQGGDFNPDLLSILEKKPYEWKLCFDPVIAVKALSWSYSKEHHILLCVLAGLCQIKKILPHKVDPTLVMSIADAMQSQEQFKDYKNQSLVCDNPCVIDVEKIKVVCKTFVDFLHQYVKIDHDNEEYLKYIETALMGYNVT